MTREPMPADPDPGPWVGKTADELLAFLGDAARLWLAHDGLWFQAVERRFGQEAAIECDRDAWAQFSPIEARRILERLGPAAGRGLDALDRALKHRLYGHLNPQAIERPAPDRLILRILTCRVQEARRRKGLPDFPCRSVGIVEYSTFAQAVNPRIETRCLVCPPDPTQAGTACAWEFTMGDGGRL
jgi:hypothetical protein